MFEDNENALDSMGGAARGLRLEENRPCGILPAAIRGAAEEFLRGALVSRVEALEKRFRWVVSGQRCGRRGRDTFEMPLEGASALFTEG